MLIRFDSSFASKALDSAIWTCFGSGMQRHTAGKIRLRMMMGVSTENLNG
jgi:hypothetical protein